MGLAARRRAAMLFLMGSSSVTGIGDGAPPFVSAESLLRSERIEVVFRRDNIQRPTDWHIHDSRHSAVIHLGGRMDCLETELEGRGGSFGTAFPGEVWTVPAERRYASHAHGGEIEYALIRIAPGTDRRERDFVPLAAHRDDFLHREVRRLRRTGEKDDDVSTMETDSILAGMRRHFEKGFGIGTAPRSKPGPRLDHARLRALRRRIRDRLGTRLALDDLASFSGMGTHHFLEAFREAFGESPAQYIIGQRLREARRLLATTRRDLTDIALDCGFSSHSHFSATFRRRLGTSPSEYRAKALS